MKGWGNKHGIKNQEERMRAEEKRTGSEDWKKKGKDRQGKESEERNKKK